MHDQLTFESRLADAYERYLVVMPVAIDPRAMAAQAAARARPGPRVKVWLRPGMARLVLAAAVLLGLALGAAVVGNLLDTRVQILPVPSATAPTPSPASSPAWRLERASDEIETSTIEGGRGVVAAFEPAFLITLPGASYDATVGSGWASAVSSVPERTLLAVYNPLGVTDPCSMSGVSAEANFQTIDAFSAYLDSLPGLTVQSTPMVIGGRVAAQLVIPSVQTADCPSHRVYEWKAPRLSDQTAWFLNQGDTDVVYVVDYANDILLLQWLGADVTTDEAQALFATLSFDDLLRAP